MVKVPGLISSMTASHAVKLMPAMLQTINEVPQQRKSLCSPVVSSIRYAERINDGRK